LSSGGDPFSRDLSDSQLLDFAGQVDVADGDDRSVRDSPAAVQVNYPFNSRCDFKSAIGVDVDGPAAGLQPCCRALVPDVLGDLVDINLAVRKASRNKP